MFDHVFHEHLIEHLNLEESIRFTGECFRVLRSGGVLRIATPDLEFLLGLSRQRKTTVQRQYVDWALRRFRADAPVCCDAVVINNFFHDWGHKFIHNGSSLAAVLRVAGFKRIERTDVGQSRHLELCGLERHGNAIPGEFNRLETMVFEATKS
jgi:predicted SAM-dependent methyltransferase